MFTYNERKIISATPLADITAYLTGLGGVAKPGADECVFEYAGLEIVIAPMQDSAFPALGIPRHLIDVRGDKALAEQFLTAFRFRFMSAGG